MARGWNDHHGLREAAHVHCSHGAVVTPPHTRSTSLPQTTAADARVCVCVCVCIRVAPWNLSH